MFPPPPSRRLSVLLTLLSALAALPAPAGDLAIRNVHVYPAPGEARLDDATVIIREGVIVSVGSALAFRAIALQAHLQPAYRPPRPGLRT